MRVEETVARQAGEARRIESLVVRGFASLAVPEAMRELAAAAVLGRCARMLAPGDEVTVRYLLQSGAAPLATVALARPGTAPNDDLCARFLGDGSGLVFERRPEVRPGRQGAPLDAPTARDRTGLHIAVLEGAAGPDLALVARRRLIAEDGPYVVPGAPGDSCAFGRVTVDLSGCLPCSGGFPLVFPVTEPVLRLLGPSLPGPDGARLGLGAGGVCLGTASSGLDRVEVRLSDRAWSPRCFHRARREDYLPR